MSSDGNFASASLDKVISTTLRTHHRLNKVALGSAAFNLRSMKERDYSHRDVVDKLGIKPGHIVAFDEAAWQLDEELRRRVVARALPPGASGHTVNIALVTVDRSTNAVETLRRWKARLDPAGGIWLLTPKRGQSGYVDQRELIPAGVAAGLLDNKSCSVSDTVSAMRFVIRKEDRGNRG